VKKSKILGIILIVAGILAIVYGSFTFTRETHETKIGPIELTVKDNETVEIPTWAGITLIVAGTILLILKGRR
jgi:drug/metabolite transporter (DMT)-like permease